MSIRFISHVMMNWCMLLAGILYCMSGYRVQARIPLTIAGFADINVTVNGWSSAGVIPAIEMALEDVNVREGLLENYYLRWTPLDSRTVISETYKISYASGRQRCDSGLAVKLLFDHISHEPSKLMILGGGCSPATEPVAEAAKYFNLIQVGYSPASPSLSSRTRFRNFFRTCPVSTSRNPSAVTLLNFYNWKKVATITEYVPNLAATTTNLHAYLRKSNITLLVAETITQDQSPAIPLDNIEEKDAKVIIFNGYEGAARRVFCEAYRKKMYGPHYQWIIPGFYSAGWLNETDTGSGCTSEQIKTAINKAFNIKHLGYDTTGRSTISGMSYEQYESRYKNLSRQRGYPENDFHSYGYDAVWAMALALNSSISVLETLHKKLEDARLNGPLHLEDFNYTKYFAIVFSSMLSKTVFHGVSGYVSFNMFGDRNGLATQVYQFQEDGDDVPVGIYLSDQLNIYRDSPPSWHGSGPPSDSLLRVVSRVQINSTLYRCVISLAACGVLLGLGFLIYNITHMNYRHIKMSSPRLNNLIVLGCILGYMSVALYGLDTRLVPSDNLHYVCSTCTGMLLLAFTFAFGAMFAKTWRVHAIFTSRVVSTKVLRDVHLFAFVMVLVFIDVIVMLVWNFVDPVTTSIKIVRTEETDISLLITEVDQCTSDHQFYWVGAIYVEKGLMLIFGCFLAYETKHVHVPGLNDSRYIGMCVYNVVVMCIVGVTINLALADQKDVVFAFTSACIIFCSTVTLCLLFIPKIRQLALEKKSDMSSLPGPDVEQTRNGRLFSSTFHYTMEQITKLRHSFSRNSRVSEMTDTPRSRCCSESDLAEKLIEKEKELKLMASRIAELELRLAHCNQQVRRRSRDGLFHTMATSTFLRTGEEATEHYVGPAFEAQMLY